MVDTNKWDPAEYEISSYIQANMMTHVMQDFIVPPTSHLLDIGCGDGHHTFNLSKQASQGCAVGFDRSAEMTAFAKQKYADVTNLSFENGDVLNLPYENQFDVITSFACLHWLEDKQTVFNNIFKALKSNGKLFVCMPFVDDVFNGHIYPTMKSDRWSKYFKSYDMGVYNLADDKLRKILDNAGFKVELVSTYLQQVPLPSLEYFHKFMYALPLFHNNLPEELIPEFVDEITAAFAKNCEKTADGKHIFTQTCQEIRASKL